MTYVMLIGKPNSGKSLLFNRLTGLTQKVANFPGVTVEIKRGRRGNLDIVDFPGTYSLNYITKDEEVAVSKFRRALKDKDLDTVFCVLDVTNLEQSLIVGLQTQREAHEAGKSTVFVLNVMDEIWKKNLPLNLDFLRKEVAAPVYPVSARTERGLDELLKYLDKIEGGREPEIIPLPKPAGSLRQRAREIADGTLSEQAKSSAKRHFLDRVFLSPIWGGLAFFAVMFFLFQSIFTWAAPLMDGMEWLIATIGSGVTTVLPDGGVKDFLNDAVFGGIGGFLVFVPQIMVLTFVIGLLEDSGYMARAAVICHRFLRIFGLSGRSFVPLLSGHACAIPAIMATRSIESPRKRLLTILAIPFMSCSARLPVYSVLIAALIPATPILGGLFGLQGFALFVLYGSGILVGLLVSGAVSKTKLAHGEDSPFLIELPQYRFPSLTPLLRRAILSGWTFVKKAGLIIFSVTVVIWFLGYFPRDAGLANSYLGQMGKFMSPIFDPLGLDWKYGIAILASFVAREVFVGTLGTLFGIEGADERMGDVATQIQESGLSLSSALALLAFYVVSLQCASTLAVIKQELHSRTAPIIMFVAYSILAYVIALGVKAISG